MNGVVIVTGASSGIGKATTAKILKVKLTVYAAVRYVSKLSDLKSLVLSNRIRCHD